MEDLLFQISVQSRQAYVNTMLFVKEVNFFTTDYNTRLLVLAQ